MMMIPHSAALKFGKTPWVSFSIIIISLLIFNEQVANKERVFKAVISYCSSIYHEELTLESDDILRKNKRRCVKNIQGIHSHPDPQRLLAEAEAEAKTDRVNEKINEQTPEIVKKIRAHYYSFRQTAPQSLNSRLVYDPVTWNPVRVLSSSISHISWMHVIGNLIFFLAFAPAIELLIGSAFRFIGIMVLISFVSHYVYSISTLISGEPIPSLGLSGVVMGLIGLSAFLIPNARIRTFVWFGFFIKNLYIPAWILAVWYIGWDTWDIFTRTDYGSINLVSHVSGGIAGYLSGHLFFRNRREEINTELNEEIESQRAFRTDRQWMLGSSRINHDKSVNDYKEQLAKKEYSLYINGIFRAVSSERDSDAIMLLLEKYNQYCSTPIIYEEIYEEMKDWRRGRAFFCVARLVISLCIMHGQIARALYIAEECLNMNDKFVVADSVDVIALTQHAVQQGMHPLVALLVQDSHAKYGNDIARTLMNIRYSRAGVVQAMS